MYQSKYGLLIRNGREAFANLDVSAGDLTAAPANVSVIRPDMLDRIYMKLATKVGVTPDKVSEAQLLAEFQLTDKRPAVTVAPSAF